MTPKKEQISNTYILDGTVVDHSCEPRQTCPDCGGDHYCHTCGSTGRVTCSSCDGRGNAECSKCNGSGVCSLCEGRGYRICWYCNGSGLQRDGDGVRNCHFCHGRGRVDCDRCHGDRKCDKCHGRGHIECRTCQGNGNITCSKCHGSGSCQRCSSDGTITCMRCQGSGYYQTYTAFQATAYSKYKSLRPKLIDAYDIDELRPEVIYSGTTREWVNGENQAYNKEQEVQTVCLAKMDSSEQKQFNEQMDLIRRMRSNSLAPNSGADRPWQSNIEIKRLPVTIVTFTVEGKEYEVQFLGNDYKMLASTPGLPTKIESLKMSDKDDRHMRNSSPGKRARAFLLLGEYLCTTLYRESSFSSSNNLYHPLSFLYSEKDKGQERLRQYLRDNQYINEEYLLKEIAPLMHSKKTLAFIWQIIGVDRQPNEEALKLFKRIADKMGLGEKDINSAKVLAASFSKLPGEEAAKEYVEPELDTRGDRAILWITLLIIAGILAGIFFGIRAGVRYIKNDYIPKRALTHQGTCNRLATEAIEKNDFKTAHYYLTEYCRNRTREDKNSRKVSETVELFVNKALKTTSMTTAQENPLPGMAAEVFLAFDQSTYKTCKDECDRMRDQLVNYYLNQGDLLTANSLMAHAGPALQTAFGTEAIRYLVRADQKKLADTYYSGAIKFLRPYTHDIQALERGWKKTMKAAAKEEKIKPDPNVVRMLRMKAPQGGDFRKWVPPTEL